MDESLEQVYSAAMALPPQSRAILVGMIQESLGAECVADDRRENANDPLYDDVDEIARRLTQHFHEAKQVALRRGGYQPYCALPIQLTPKLR